MDALAGLLLLFDLNTLIGLVGGIGYGLVIGIIPGLGGGTALTILLPFTFAMEANTALAAIVGMMAVNTTSDTIPAVLFGVPGTSSSQATVIDGHAMARQGRAKEALGASYAASMLGGIFGAVLLGVSIPVIGRLIPYIATPDLLAICILGLSFAASVSGKYVVKGMASACLGILVSLIGLSSHTGEERWTFGALYFWDGVPLVPLALAVFAVPAVLSMANRPFFTEKPPASDEDATDSIMRGVRAARTHWFLILRSGWLGSALGAIPGIGGSVIDWVAYGSAARTVKNPETFGSGDIRGVIAPEGANNARDGGALIPTITLGIPGSAGMALVLSAFTIQGLSPGRGMLTENLDQTYMLVWGLVIANVIGASICLFFTKYLALIVQAPAPFLVPGILTIAFMGAFQGSQSLGDLWVLVGLGSVAWYLRWIDWPLAPFILGVVLGGIIERYLFLSLSLYGWSWALQPVPLLLLTAAAWVAVSPLFRQTISSRKPRRRAASQNEAFVAIGSIGFSIASLVVLAVALRQAATWNPETGTAPLVIGSVAVGLLVAVLLEAVLTLAAVREKGSLRQYLSDAGRAKGLYLSKGTILLALMFSFVLGSYFIGMLPSILFFVPAAYVVLGGRNILLMAVFTLGLFGFVDFLFDEILAVPWAHPVFPAFQHFLVKII